MSSAVRARLVGRDAQVGRRGAGVAGLGRQGGGARVDHLAGAGLGRDPDQLVAGRDDRDPRPPDHRQVPVAQRRGDAELARAQPRAGRDDVVARGDVLAGAADVVAGPGRGQPDPVARGVGVLEHDDRVGAGRQRRAGHDPDRGARGERGRLAGAGEGRRRHRQLAGQVGGADREAVHRRRVEAGQGAGGDQVGGQAPAPGVGQRDVLGGERGDPFEDAGLGLGDGAHAPT